MVRASEMEHSFWCKDLQLDSVASSQKRKWPRIAVSLNPIKQNKPKPKIQETKNKIDLEKERMKKAKEGKREAKQAQITAGKELASKLFSATIPRTSTNLLHERDSAEELLLGDPKRNRIFKGSITQKRGQEKGMNL